MIKIKIIEMKSERHEPNIKPYTNVNFKFNAPINLEKVVANNPNIEYDPQLGTTAIIRTEYGSIQLYKSGAQIPRLKENKEDCLIELKRFILAIVNGEKRTFMDWLRSDFKQFQKEIGV